MTTEQILMFMSAVTSNNQHSKSLTLDIQAEET